MLIALMFGSGIVSKSWADVIPGSVYKDFTTPIVAAPNTDKFGVCGSVITYVGGSCTNGNPPTSKTLIIDDLNNAIKAEVYVSMWGGHVGTTEQKLSVNSTSFDISASDWKPLPQPVSTPTQNLSYDRAIYYHRTLHSTVPIDISIASLKTGTNTINFWAKSQTSSGLRGYPLYWIYSYTVRVYYDSSKRTHPTGTISVIPGSDSQTFSASASYSEGIKQVDFIGYYKDFNWEGDGRFQNWHYIYSNGNLSKHIGTATSSPYSVRWNTTWIPDQDQPMKVVARIVGNDKMCYITDAVNLTFSRNYAVKLYSSHNVPEAFAVRASLTPKTCDITINDSLSRATGAKLIVPTWGAAGEADDATVHELGINNTPIAGLPPLPPFGAYVKYSSHIPDYTFEVFDIPHNILSGTNKFYIKSNTAHHAAEVNWPGPVILVKYNTISMPTASINDLGTGTWNGFIGGLYPNGSNDIPVKHKEAGIQLAKEIQPLDSNGNPDPANGEIVFISIGMSNTTMAFSTFVPMGNADKNKNPKVKLVDCAEGGMSSNVISIVNAESYRHYWDTTIVNRLSAAGVTAKQVQVIWYKEAFPVGSSGPTPQVYSDSLIVQSKRIMNIIKTKFPNAKICYIASRIYAGYATTSLNPEPYAYWQGWTMKWMIEEQINNDPMLQYSGEKPNSPWLCWGTYNWANGNVPRSDGLTWIWPTDFNSDGTHPSVTGRQKVATRLLTFLDSDITACWYRVGGCSELLGINKIAENVIKIYPVPADGQLAFSETLKDIVIYNIYGQPALPEIKTANSISVSGLKNGIYFMHSEKSVMKFIVQH